MPLRFSALTLLICALWASVGVAIKVSLADAPPLGLAAVRMLLAAAALWLWMRARGPVRVDRASRRPVLVATVFYSLLLAFTHLGFGLTSAARGIVLLNTTPLFVALLARVLPPREPLGAAKIAGLATAFAGVVVIFARRLNDGGGAGDVLMILAAISWSFHILWTKRRAAKVDAAVLTLVQFAGAAAVLGVISLGLEPLARWRPTAELGAGIIYLALAGTALAWLMWAHVLKHVAATTASAFIFLVPLFGVALSWALLGEAMTAQIIAGACLISLGILIVALAPRLQLIFGRLTIGQLTDVLIARPAKMAEERGSRTHQGPARGPSRI
jgi:drug/metabolite transporter (DMT)-like permease